MGVQQRQLAMRVCVRALTARSVGVDGDCVRARRDKQSVRDSARESSSSSRWQCAHPRQTEGQWQGCCVQWPEPQQHGPRCVFKVILIPRRFAAACVRVRRVCRCARAISSRSVVLCPGRHWDSNFCDLRHHAGRPCARKKCAASVSCRPCSVLLSLILT